MADGPASATRAEPGFRSGSGVDLARLCVEFTDLLRSAGVVVPVERVVWWTQATLAADPRLTTDLHWLGRVTLVDRSEHLETFDAVFAQVFRGFVDVAAFRGQAPLPTRSPAESVTEPGAPDQPRPPPDSAEAEQAPAPEVPVWLGPDPDGSGSEGDDAPAPAVLAVASETEILRDRDFAECSDAELAQLMALVDRMRVIAPTRPARWQPARAAGRTVDLRRTLRAACRTGGDPITWRYRRRGTQDRHVVLLADVSGSMQAYSRIYLRVLQAAVLGARAHAYVFATRLHPVTRTLGRGRPADAVTRALAASPDAAGGTRIGTAIKTFLDTDGRRGVARGSVVVIVSDGWERADPAALAEQMARLARLAHRVIWVNPRKAAPGFAPLAGGMAAALPYIDTFVSGHSAQAVQELLDAVASI